MKIIKKFIVKIVKEYKEQFVMKNFYFTFGTASRYPYGIDDYIIIRAYNMEDAKFLLKKQFPNCPNSDCLYYTSLYSEEEFIENDIIGRFYSNKPPAEIMGRLLR